MKSINDVENYIKVSDKPYSEAADAAKDAAKALNDLFGTTEENTSVLVEYMDGIINLDKTTARLEEQFKKLQHRLSETKDPTKQANIQEQIQSVEKEKDKTSRKKAELIGEAKEITGVDIGDVDTEEYSRRKRRKRIADKKAQTAEAAAAKKAKMKAQKIGGIVDAIMGVAKFCFEYWKMTERLSISILKETIDLEKTRFDAEMAITSQYMKMSSGQATRGLGVGYSMLTEGITAGAWGAANNRVKNLIEQETFEQDKRTKLLKKENDESKRKLAGKQEREKISTAGYAAMTAAAFGVVGAVVGSIIPGAGTAAGAILGAAIGGILGEVVGTAFQAYQESLEIKHEKSKLALDYATQMTEQQREMEEKIYKQGLETAQDFYQKVSDMSRKIEDIVAKMEQTYHQIGSEMGFSGQNLKGYTKSMMQTHIDVSWIGGADTAQKISNMQSTSNQTSGFNTLLTKDDIEKGMSVGKLFGDDGLVNQITASMEIFNISIADGSELLFEMYKTANKVGVSNKKFAKDFQNNLRLANKYTFKGGVEALAKMTLWSQKTRFNMQSLDQMISKVHDGGLEGVIQQSAKLQVLGGNAALGSNPLAMMYEAWNDPDAFGKRMHSMTAGLGYFDKETGQAVIKGADAMQLQAIAQAQGRSVEDLRAETEQRIKTNQIDKNLASNYTDEQKQLIYSKAKFDKDTQQWQVAVHRNGEVQDININDLNAKDFVELMPSEDQLVNYTKSILDWLTMTQSQDAENQARAASQVYEDYQANAEKRLNDSKEFFSEDMGLITDAVKEQMKFVTESAKIEQDNFSTYAEVSKQYMGFLTENSANISLKATDALTVLKAMQGDLSAMGEIRGNAVGVQESDKEDAKLFESLTTKGDPDIEGKIAKMITSLQNGDTDKLEEVWADIHGGWVSTTEDDAFKKLTDAERKDFEDWGKMEKALRAYIRVKQAKDGVMQANNMPMLTAASSVIPINDGKVEFAKSHPQDSAIFAKVGGPFDKLFNGVFSQINSIYNGLFGNTTTKGGTNNINLNMNGRISLDCNGTSVDISNELKNNPMFVKAMAQEIVMQLSRNVNGGKTTLFDYIKSIKS